MLNRMRRSVRAVAAAALAAALIVPMQATQADADPRPDRTSKTEAKRVDKVKTPKLDWFPCGNLDCATVWLPLDYDKPNGKKVEIALTRVRASDQANKIGTVFINPGGPGGPGADATEFFAMALGEQVTERFDVIGFDPRGIGSSTQVKCFDTVREQTRALQDAAPPFPVTAEEIAGHRRAMRNQAVACSTSGKPLSEHMSTANVARDMEILRRAVGDSKLTYYGVSYGSYLGQVYANLFPDRVRALAIDGVLDPVAWAGTRANRDVPVTLRLRSGDGAHKALIEALDRCAAAGPEFCALEDPHASFDAIIERLEEGPIEVPIMDDVITLRYQDFVATLLTMLYSEDGPEMVMAFIRDTLLLTQLEPVDATRTAAALRVKAAFSRFDFPYNNADDAFLSVLCTDSLNPRRQSVWQPQINAAEARAPYFSQLWGWSSLACAGEYWKATDSDAYRGPFTKRTAAPVLVVGNFWDPATNYDGAVAAADLLPNSRLLSSNNWGHAALGTSECFATALTDYLLEVALPPEGTVCEARQPFTRPVEEPEFPEGEVQRRSTQSPSTIRDLVEEMLQEASPVLG